MVAHVREAGPISVTCGPDHVSTLPLSRSFISKCYVPLPYSATSTILEKQIV